MKLSLASCRSRAAREMKGTAIPGTQSRSKACLVETCWVCHKAGLHESSPIQFQERIWHLRFGPAFAKIKELSRGFLVLVARQLTRSNLLAESFAIECA